MKQTEKPYFYSPEFVCVCGCTLRKTITPLKMKNTPNVFYCRLSALPLALEANAFPSSAGIIYHIHSIPPPTLPHWFSPCETERSECKESAVFSKRRFAALPHLYVFVVSCLGLEVGSVGKRKGDVWLRLSDGLWPIPHVYSALEGKERCCVLWD